MTLEKAIEELDRGTRQNRSTNNQSLREALRLGREALSRIRTLRVVAHLEAAALLPSETKS